MSMNFNLTKKLNFIIVIFITTLLVSCNSDIDKYEPPIEEHINLYELISVSTKKIIFGDIGSNYLNYIKLYDDYIELYASVQQKTGMEPRKYTVDYNGFLIDKVVLDYSIPPENGYYGNDVSNNPKYHIIQSFQDNENFNILSEPDGDYYLFIDENPDPFNPDKTCVQKFSSNGILIGEFTCDSLAQISQFKYDRIIFFDGLFIGFKLRLTKLTISVYEFQGDLDFSSINITNYHEFSYLNMNVFFVNSNTLVFVGFNGSNYSYAQQTFDIFKKCNSYSGECYLSEIEEVKLDETADQSDAPWVYIVKFNA